MYLSRLILNPRSRQVQSEIARLYQMHKTIMKAFPERLPPDERVLFRLDENQRNGIVLLLVQSQHRPDWAYLSNGMNYLLPIDDLPSSIRRNPGVKQVDLQLNAGQQLAFRLYANPTRRLGKSAGVDKGKRVELVNEEDQQEWLNRKLKYAGAQLQTVRTSQAGKIKAKQKRNGREHTITLFGVRFDGKIKVTDPHLLVDAVNNGIGRGKGFGFGLLSLAPADG